MFRWWLVTWFLLAASPAAAEETGHLERAISLFEEMEYDAARQAAERALASPRSGPGELLRAYRIQGLCLSALGQDDAALEAFSRLLAIDPAFRLSADVSPKLAAPFYQAVAMARSRKPILLRHPRPEPGETLGGTVLRIALKSNPFGMVREVRMRFVTPGGGNEKQMTASVSGTTTLGMRLPRDLAARAVRYYFEAVNQHGGVLARKGSRDQPFELRARLAPLPTPVPSTPVSTAPAGTTSAPGKTVPEPDRDEPTPWYKSWWFWTTVSVVIVGSTTGAILASEAPDHSGPVDYGIRLE